MRVLGFNLRLPVSPFFGGELKAKVFRKMLLVALCKREQDESEKGDCHPFNNMADCND